MSTDSAESRREDKVVVSVEKQRGSLLILIRCHNTTEAFRSFYIPARLLRSSVRIPVRNDLVGVVAN